MPDEVLALRSDHLRDPHWRWQRHTYQEGPGFRFLATRGGRPPLEAAPRHDLAIVRERARLVRILREEGLDAAKVLGRSSRASLFRWQAAYQRGGPAALLPRRCGPRVPLVKHPAWVEQVVIAVRLATSLRPSATTGPRSPIAASRTSRRLSTCKAGSRTSVRRPEAVSKTTGNFT